MQCPICGSSDLSLAERLGVEIDYCPRCRGVWLDRGELDKIVALSASSAEHRSREIALDESGEFDVEPPRRESQTPRRRKKSPWRELFDFD